jgi:hypothetical protein
MRWCRRRHRSSHHTCGGSRRGGFFSFDTQTGGARHFATGAGRWSGRGRFSDGRGFSDRRGRLGHFTRGLGLRFGLGNKCGFRLGDRFSHLFDVHVHMDGFGRGLDVHLSFFVRRVLVSGRLDRFHQTRTQRGGGRLRRFHHLAARLRTRLGRHLGSGLRGSSGRFGEHRRGRRQRDVPLACLALDELTRDDFLDGTRGALHLNAGLALEQAHGFLAGQAQELSDFVNPDSGQKEPRLIANLKTKNGNL